MGDHELRSYPPESDPDARYRAIVERGAAMRRRRTLGTGAGIGASLLVVALAVVLLGGTAPENNQVVAGEGETPTTSEPTTTSTSMPPSTDLTVSIATGPPLSVVVTDPIQPDLDGAQQCVLVGVRGPDAELLAEGFGCSSTPETGPVDLPLSMTDGVSIGCAATITRGEPGGDSAGETVEISSTFRLDLPDQITPGTYTLEVSATSGVGDGCAGSGNGSAEAERDVTTSGTFTVS